MKFFLVDVVCITCAKAREQFDTAKIEALAETILECDGLLRPVILKATGPESFEVIDGFLEYWAAVRVREKNPRKGEMVNAFVVPTKSEKTILKQVRILQGGVTLHEFVTPASVPKGIEEILQSFKNELENLNQKMDMFVSLPSQLSGMIQQLERNFQKEMEFNGRFQQLELTKQAETVKKVVDYASKTVAELKEEAKKRGIAYKSKIKKAELMDLLEKHDSLKTA